MHAAAAAAAAASAAVGAACLWSHDTTMPLLHQWPEVLLIPAAAHAAVIIEAHGA